jgi:hypothetical protein
MRSLHRFLVLGPLVAAAMAFADVAPAAAKDSGVCTLLTRSEAGKLLRAKVVKAEKDASPANGAQECTYKTKKTGIKDRGLKLHLQVTVQPITDELRADLENIPFDDGSRVEGLGDTAYVTKFDQVIAVSGTTVVAAKLQNYQGASSKFRDVSEGAVRIALTRLDRVTVAPPSSPGS